MNSIEDLRSRFIDERPHYEAVATAAYRRIEAGSRDEGLRLRFDYRAKEVPSLVKKALIKQLDYSEIVDKAGVRVIYAYRWELEMVEKLLARDFVVLKREDMSEKLKPNELDYLGIHYDVRLNDDDIAGIEQLAVEPICEVQLHSWQQNTWAHYSHELLYKARSEAPRDVARSLHRLLAMVEIFDQEVNVARKYLLEMHGYEVARVVDRLEREFFRHLARDYDGELTASLLEAVLPLYSGRDVESIVEEFIADQGAKLERFYSIYREDPRATPLLFQPEAILLFAALEEMPSDLESAFAGVAPKELLRELAVAWGSPID